MKLWVNGEAGSPGAAIRAKVSGRTADINHETKSRSVRALNALRNAELRVLKGPRSGRVYHVPGTYGRASKATRKLKGEYGHRLRRGQLYRASAPGEAPARRTGNLRMHWDGDAESTPTSNGGVSVLIAIESQERYAGDLEKGTPRMAPRPFVEKIKQEAIPEIRKIYREPYT